MKKGIHIVNLKTQKKEMSPYFCFLYPIRVHIESPKCEMIFLKSPKSSFLFLLTNSGQKSLTMFISSCSIDFFKNRGNYLFFKLSSLWDSNPQPLCVEATKHLRNMKTAEKTPLNFKL